MSRRWFGSKLHVALRVLRGRPVAYRLGVLRSAPRPGTLLVGTTLHLPPGGHIVEGLTFARFDGVAIRGDKAS